MAAAEGIAFLDKQAAKKRRELPITWFSQAAMPESSPAIVKGLLEPKTLGVIYGESGCGKTFFTIDLFFHVAQAIPWRSRKVQRVLVVYVAAEAGSAILKRFIALRERGLGEVADPGPLAILTRGPNLLDGGEVVALIEQLKVVSKEAGMPVGVVVFDTLSRSIPGGDENSPEDMTRLIEVADRLRDELGATTVLVHHTGKDPSKGARGHSALFSAADLVISVTNGRAVVEKLRDGVAGTEFPFELEVVELGRDEDGEPITTCTVRHLDAVKQHKDAKALTGVARVALQSLLEAIADHGEIVPGTTTIPRGVRCVALDQWRSRFALRYGTDPQDGKRDSDAVRKAFQRGREALMQRSLIGISSPYVWTT